jgi:hypothetical protein
MTDLPRHEQIASHSVASLSPEERLIWLLGDMMTAAENFFGAENPKREGHIHGCAIRILDEVVAPIRAAALEEAATMVEQSTLVDYSILKYFAADIRALKEQP